MNIIGYSLCYLEWWLKTCRWLCFLIGPQLCMWSSEFLDWTLLATGNLTSLLLELLSYQWQPAGSSSPRQKACLSRHRLTVVLPGMSHQSLGVECLKKEENKLPKINTIRTGHDNIPVIKQANKEWDHTMNYKIKKNCTVLSWWEIGKHQYRNQMVFKLGFQVN